MTRPHPFKHPRWFDTFGWDEPTFLANTEGSAIRRAGYENFLRNVAVGLGNVASPAARPAAIAALRARADDPSARVREHVAWALAEQAARGAIPGSPS